MVQKKASLRQNIDIYSKNIYLDFFYSYLCYIYLLFVTTVLQSIK